jgi:hypothetical protein
VSDSLVKTKILKLFTTKPVFFNEPVYFSLNKEAEERCEKEEKPLPTSDMRFCVLPSQPRASNKLLHGENVR